MLLRSGLNSRREYSKKTAFLGGFPVFVDSVIIIHIPGLLDDSLISTSFRDSLFALLPSVKL